MLTNGKRKYIYSKYKVFIRQFLVCIRYICMKWFSCANGQECKCIVGSCTCIKDQEGLILIELNKKGEICL